MHNSTYEESIDAHIEIYPDFPYIQATPEEIASMKSREPVKCLCSTCGKPFYIQKNQLLARIKHNSHTAFCSRQCSSEHQKIEHSKKSYVCETCGKHVDAKDCYGNGRFCSAWCARSFSGRIAASSEEAQKKKSDSLKKWHQEHPKPKRPKASKPKSSSNRRKTYAIDEAKVIQLHQKYNLYDISQILDIPTKKLYQLAKENDLSDEIYINHRSTQSILACRNALNKPFEDGSITVEEYEQVRNECIRLMYENNLNPRQVCSEYLKLEKSYHQFLSLCMDIQLKSVADGNKAYHHRIGTYDNMDEKKKYDIQCDFRFSDKLLPYLPGYENIAKYGWYNSRSNLNGVAKDHMVSKNYGWTHNKIDPYLISHPANCMIMSQLENSQKTFKCSITLNELIERVEWFNETLLFKSDNNEPSSKKDLSYCSTLAML